ncbi:MAG: glutamate--tRNA ligase [Bacteroidales bacterium]
MNLENSNTDLSKNKSTACPKVRVRFAPSPTGPLHIGGVRTALFNYLFAKKHGGELLLRIEDTDTARFVPGAEDYILRTFQWLQIPFDEGVGIGGPHSPYRQSERKELYKKYVDQLLEANLAYYAFDTPEELENMRKTLEAEKANSQQYDATTRGSMKNSLSLSKEEVKSLLEKGAPYVVRIKINPGEIIKVHDLIRGEVQVNSDILDDKVLYKSSDGLPTYHLANIVDDHFMEISHVIRGEEWLPSAPLHVLLYRYLGWADTMPAFAHLPLLLKPDGNGKLSKRDGDRLGFPVFPLQWTDPKTNSTSTGYRESGYSPQAVINMLAFLGWNPGTEQEIFSLSELVEAFQLEKVSKSGAKFNLDKAKWFNHQYLQMQSNASLVPALKASMPKLSTTSTNTNISEKIAENSLAEKDYLSIYPIETLEKIIALVKERITFPSELWSQTYFFFIAPESYDEKVVKKRWSEDMPSILQNWCVQAEKTDFLAKSLEDLTQNLITENQWNAGKVFNCIRLSLVGASLGPHVFDILEILGKKESLQRIQHACQSIG